MSKVKITLLIAIFGSLIPAWIGSALLEQLDTTQSLLHSTTGITITVFFAISIWGTSFAFFYLKRISYALLSGLGKWALILAGIWIFSLTSGPEEHHHPYIIFIGMFLVFCWAIFDFIFLYTIAKKSNLEE